MFLELDPISTDIITIDKQNRDSIVYYTQLVCAAMQEEQQQLSVIVVC
jgi:hypothetical protein